MDTEFEIKVLDVDAINIPKKLVALGYDKMPTQSYRRYVYVTNKDGNWVRLRTDGVKTTLTYKSFSNDDIEGMRELEIEVSDFDKANAMMEQLGYKATKYQENRRTNYVRGQVEVSLDEWPMIPAYLEIEGHNRAEVELCLEELKLDNPTTTSEPTSAVYKKYGLDLDSYQHLAFPTNN